MIPYGDHRYHAIRAHGHESSRGFGRIIPKAPARRANAAAIDAGLADLADDRAEPRAPCA
jgi:hypothetical protein